MICEKSLHIWHPLNTSRSVWETILRAPILNKYINLAKPKSAYDSIAYHLVKTGLL